MDLRIQKTYFALRQAFVALLEEKRFEDITVGELCDRAMIRRTTFYKHFADKYEYFTFYIREMVQVFHRQMDTDVKDGEIGAYLLYMSRESLRFLRQHEALVRNVRSSSVFPMLLSILLEQISADTAAVMRRAGGSAADRQLLEGKAAFFAGGVTNTLFYCMNQDTPVDEEQFVGIVSKFIPAGTA